MRLDRFKTLWPELEPLLDQLLEHEEPERTRLLEQALSATPETRRALEILLRADDDASGPLDTPCALPDLVGLDPDQGAALAPGTRLGPYVVRHEIARGGMGAVVFAERDDGQFSQRVAIKLIRPDAITPGTRERFLLERRILAGLQHPNIARLLDGGVREDGSPFLVMEYVEGRPITTWCDRRRLDVRARLALFLQVCDAVEFAHRQLVVHRDLKPDNILVTDAGEVKLLDFGIAKLLDPSVVALITGTQARVFTPAYATPEQYLGGPVTVASDEYQLALVLYELITGQRARDEATASPLRLQRAVLETDPMRPSHRVGRPPSSPPTTAAPSGAPDLAAAATARATTPAALARAIAGDLDAIVLKALEREPEHRYPTVEAFHRDLENLLAYRPVTARRATLGYRLRKVARRHRVALIAGALVVLSLAAGLIGVGIQSRVAARERDLAREAERQATAINDFVLRELLESPTPERALGRSLTVAEVLANASRAVGHAFRDEPATEAAVRLTLARSYQALGNVEAAREHAEAAQRLAAKLEPVDRLRFETRELLGELALDEGKAQEAQRQLEALVADESKALGPDDPASLRSRGLVARAVAAQGRWAPADSMLRATLAALPTSDDHWRQAVDLRTWLSSVWIGQARTTEAESLLRECLTLERRHLGPEHPLIAATLRQQAIALGKDLRYAEAGAVLDQVLAMAIRLYGADHPATGDVYTSRAVNFDAQGLTDSSVAANDRAASIYRRALGADHPKTLRAGRNQAVLLRRAGRFAEADPVYEEVYRTCVRTLGAEHWQTLEVLQGMVSLRLEENRVPEARTLARRVVAAYERIAAMPDADPSSWTDYALYLIEAEPADVRDPRRAVVVARRAVEATHRHDYLALRSLGFAEDAAGDPRAAIGDLRAALALPDGVRSWTTEEKLVNVLVRHGSPGELERVLLERLETERRVRGGDDRYMAKTLRHLSRHYQRMGRDQDAERLAREALSQLRKTLPESHWEVGRAKADLGTMLLSRGAASEAESLLVQGFRALEADPEIPSTDLEEVRGTLVRLYVRAGRAPVATAWRTRIIPARRIPRS